MPTQRPAGGREGRRKGQSELAPREHTWSWAPLSAVSSGRSSGRAALSAGPSRPSAGVLLGGWVLCLSSPSAGALPRFLGSVGSCRPCRAVLVALGGGVGAVPLSGVFGPVCRASPSLPTSHGGARWMRRDRAPKRARPRCQVGRVPGRGGV